MLNFSTKLWVCLFLSVSSMAQESIVFEKGENKYTCFRIPAIVKSPNGELIAFAEGRRNSCSDFGDVDLVYKISKDNGKFWGEMRVFADYGEMQAGNPAPVWDLTDSEYPNGRLFVFYNTGNNHESEIAKGKGIREVWFKTSTDGINWSEPVNITSQVHRPKQPELDKNYNFPEDWRHYANTPGHAIQFTAERYEGRLYVPANHSEGEITKDGIIYFAHAFYTDNHGKTFKIAQNLNIRGSNESTAAELNSGEVLMNARDQSGKSGNRFYARSKDGGQSWYDFGIDESLVDPVCEGSLLKLIYRKEEYVLLSHLYDSKKRKNLVIEVSKDGGKTWENKVNVEPGSAAYSDLVSLKKNVIGVLFEKDDYNRIVFKTVNF